MPSAKKEYFKDKYRIKSTRLESWDYSAPGFYFVTVCVKGMRKCLSRIKDGQIILLNQGEIAEYCLVDSVPFYNNLRLREYSIMPNHIHALLEIKMAETIHESSQEKPPDRRLMLLFKFLGRFLMQSAKQINIYQNISGKPFWQKRPWDHIVRDEKDLERTDQGIYYYESCQME